MKRHARCLVSAGILLCLIGTVPGADLAATATGACELITRQEAATAFGAAVPAGSEQSMSLSVEGASIKAQSCLYGSVVVVAYYELGSGAQALFGRYRQEFASKSNSTDYQAVSGVGDEAFTAKGQLHIRKGQMGLLVGVTLGDRQNVRIAAKALQTEKTLAALALGRM